MKMRKILLIGSIAVMIAAAMIASSSGEEPAAAEKPMQELSGDAKAPFEVDEQSPPSLSEESEFSAGKALSAADDAGGAAGVESLNQSAAFSVSVSRGGFVPVFSYAQRYGFALSFGIDAVFPSHSFSGFYSALGISYIDMKSIRALEYVSSRMELFTGTLGPRRSFRFESPEFLKDHTFLTRGWRLDAGAYAGITRVSFTSDIQHSPIVDNVATLGAECGAYLTFLEHLDAGIGFTVQRIFTAGVPLDSVALTLCIAGSW
jgi:hypothetical protein